jgi:uncharacterized protein (TIGR01777 family)
MRIGITGVSGLVGRAVAEMARRQGHEVIGYSRSARPPAWTDEMLAQPAEAPGRLPETRLDALVHLAGESLMGLWTPAKRERIWRSRVDLTRQLVQSLRAWQPDLRPKVLVCASGIGAYGSRGDEVLTENSARGAGFLADLCREWEEAAAAAAQEFGIRVVWLRTGMVLSRDGGALPLLRRLFKTGLGGRLGAGGQWTSWIHIEDEAGLVLWALQNEPVRGPLNACAPEPVTNADFTTALACALRRPVFVHAPAFALRAALRGMAEEMLLTSQRAIPRVAEESGYSFRHPRLDGALADLLRG